MSILHEQTLYELSVAQGFTNDLAANLTAKGVAASNTEGLDTLVPKVLEIESGDVEHDDTLNKNGNPDFLHITQSEKDDFVTASDFVEDFISNATDILYADLLALIANDELIPSSNYRITNYTTTTTQVDTQSAGHDFDIIVTALSTNELSEDAKAVKHVGDTYFTNANLETWEIKYCINNDTSRFAWADTENGKGVIYYMKDEWNNECAYDFKNIKFKKSDVWLYTFGGATDDSLTGNSTGNIIKEYKSSNKLSLNFNTFGTNCSFNILGFNNNNNTFGNNCNYNTFGDGCFSNTFGNYCYYNTFGNNCTSNTFGNSCGSNTFGNNCGYNTFGNGCYSNTFGNDCSYNTFGNGCRSNNFYAGASGTTRKDYIRYVVLEDGCRYNNFYSTLTTSDNNYLQRIRIKGLENTTTKDTQIELSELNTKYEWVVCYTSGNVLKQYCPDNNDTYKIEDKSVSTWAASNKYTGFGYQAQINIPNLSESDSVNVVFGLLDAISGNYAPAIEIYSGYILVFAKVNTTITIPTIEITKIDL